MRSIVLSGAGRGTRIPSVTELPVPKLVDGDLLVEMRVCGLCGTDIEKLKGEYLTAMPVLGHEAVGVVSGTQGDSMGYVVGERVFPHHHVSCGICYYCQHGSVTMCDSYRKSNLDPGGFSESFRVPALNVRRGGVLRVPTGLSDEVATLIEPVGCCIRAIEKSDVKADDTVLVVGAGPVGLEHSLLLASMKARVILSDVSEWRLRFAESGGFGDVIDARTADVQSTVRSETGGRGADVAIIASGSQSAVSQGVRSVRKGGRICLFGIPVEGSLLDHTLSEFYGKELSIVSSYGASESETTKALGILAEKQNDFRRLITDRFPLSEFDKGMRAVERGETMKVVIVP